MECPLCYGAMLSILCENRHVAWSHYTGLNKKWKLSRMQQRKALMKGQIGSYFWMSWSSNNLRISELEKFSELGSFLYFRNFGRQYIMSLKGSKQDTGASVCIANNMGGTCWVVQCTLFSAVRGSPDSDGTELEFCFWHILLVNQHVFLWLSQIGFCHL